MLKQRRSFHLEPGEQRKLSAELELLGFSGKGGLSKFFKRMIDPNYILIFINSKDQIKIEMKNG